MSTSLSMAPVDTAYNSISPYQPTNIFSIKNTSSNQELKQQLNQTVDLIHEFIFEKFKTVGIDNKGKVPSFYMGLNEKNAFYMPKGVKIEEYFAFHNGYIKHPEVVCHEYAHGIIHHEMGLGNQGVEGAINEAIADVVGIVFKRSLHYTDWSIGEMRDLSQRFTEQDLHFALPTSTNDQGYVHYNSRLVSHAFYRYMIEYQEYGDHEKEALTTWMRAAKMLASGEVEKTFEGFAKATLPVIVGNPYREALIKIWTDLGVKIE